MRNKTKKILSLILIVILTFSASIFTGLLKAFFDIPQEEFIEAKGYVTTVKKAPSTGSPSEYSAKDNIAFLAYNASNKNFSSVTTGTVSGSVAGISQEQQVLNKRFVNDSFYVVETSSTGLVSFATQKYFNKDKQLVLLRDANNPKDLSKGYQTKEPYAFSFNGYVNNYVWLPNQLGAYTVCDETINSISDVKKLDNGDYEIVIDLDTKYGVYYYRYEVKANAGVDAFPVFSSVKLTVTFSNNWILKSVNSYEEYKNKAPGMSLWASCTGNLTEVFDFSETKLNVKDSDLNFFQSYEYLTPNDDAPIIKELNGFDYLMQAFSTYLTQVGYFDISINLNGRLIDLHLYLDLKNNTYGVFSDKGSVIYKGDNLYLDILDKGKYFIDITGISNPYDVALDFILSDLDLNLDTTSLTDDIIDAITNGNILKEDNKVKVVANINLFNISLPLNFNYLKTKDSYQLVDINLNKTFFNKDINLKFVPSLLDAPSFDLTTYKDFTENLNSLLSKLPNFVSKDLINNSIDFFNNAKTNIFNILDAGSMYSTFNYSKNDLKVDGDFYLEFIDDLNLETNINFTYKKLSLDFKLLYIDDSFYLEYERYTLKLTTSDLIEIFTNLYNEKIFTVDDLENVKTPNVEFSYNVLDEHNISLNVASALINITDLKVDNKFILNKDNKVISYNDFKDLLDFGKIKTLITNFNTYLDKFKDLNIDIDLDKLIDTFNLIKDNLFNILDSRYLSLDICYKDSNLNVLGYLVIDFRSDLKVRSNLKLTYNNLSFNLDVIYLNSNLYIDLGNVLVTLTDSDILDLAKKFSSIEFKVPSLGLDYNTTKTTDHLVDFSLLDNKLNLSLSDNIKDVDYNIDLSKQTISYFEVSNLIDAAIDLKDYVVDNKISLNFNSSLISSDLNLDISGFLVVDILNFNARVNLVVFDNNSNKNHYFNIVFLDNLLYLTYRSDLNSKNNLSIKSTLDDLSTVIDKAKEVFKLDLELNAASFNLNDLLQSILVDSLSRDIKFNFKYNINDLDLLFSLAIKKDNGVYKNLNIIDLSYDTYKLNLESSFLQEQYDIFVEQVTYYSMSDLIPLLDALIDTINLKEWHITGTVNVNMLGGIINLDMPYDFHIKLEEGESEPLVEGTLQIPVFFAAGLNNDIPYKFGDLDGGYDRTLYIYHEKGRTVFYRHEYLTAAFFKKDTFERYYAVDNNQFENNLTDILLRYGIGMTDTYMSQIEKSAQREDRNIDFANVLKGLFFDRDLNKFDLSLNLGALADDPSLKNANISMFINEDNIISNLQANMQVTQGITINIKTTDMTLRDINKPYDFSSKYYDTLNTYPYNNGEVWQGRSGKIAKTATMA